MGTLYTALPFGAQVNFLLKISFTQGPARPPRVPSDSAVWRVWR